jgi:hypothetical protein
MCFYRFAKHCVRCDVRRDFGRSLLADHSLIADSPMGEYILLKSRLDSATQIEDPKEAEIARWKTLIAALVNILHGKIKFGIFKFPIN